MHPPVGGLHCVIMPLVLQVHPPVQSEIMSPHIFGIGNACPHSTWEGVTVALRLVKVGDPANTPPSWRKIARRLSDIKLFCIVLDFL